MLPDHLAGDAKLLISPAAKIALAARGKIMKANPITRFEPLHHRTSLFDDPRHLMAKRQRQWTHG
jgi:hypothetical protein